MEELNFIDIAKPPASSDGFVMRLPLERRLRLLLSISLFLARLKAALIAAVFVFIVSDIGFILRDYVLFRDIVSLCPILVRVRQPKLKSKTCLAHKLVDVVSCTDRGGDTPKELKLKGD